MPAIFEALKVRVALPGHIKDMTVKKKTRIKLTHLMQNHEILDPALWRCSTSVLGLNLIIVYSFNLRKKLDKTWSLYSSDLFISNIRNVIFMFSLVVQYLFVVVEVWNPYLLKHGLVMENCSNGYAS